jgi:hypothetical protein
MAANLTRDIVVDTNIIRLYANPDDPLIRALFVWIRDFGTLALSQKLLAEYIGIGNRDLAGLIDRLTRAGRINSISNQRLKEFNQDRHYAYTANSKDRWHARLVFLSIRKLLVSVDKKLINDVNGFKRMGGVKPRATSRPQRALYQ